MTVWFALLVLGAYLLGALPVHYWVAKRHKGIDLRQYGTGQVGAGNLWRMTSNWKIGLAIGAFDFTKGMVMVLVARFIGLDIVQQVVIGLAAIIGHNWSVFLHFGGGRGVATALGVIFLLPLINGLPPWGLAVFVIIAGVIVIILHTTPLSVLVGIAAVPVVAWVFNKSAPLALGFLAIWLIIVVKRLTAERSAETVSIGNRRLFLNRLLFDRDIKDRKVWMNRKPVGQQGAKKG